MTIATLQAMIRIPKAPLCFYILGKVLAVLNRSFDPQEQCGLPLVQLAQLIVLEQLQFVSTSTSAIHRCDYLVSKHLLVFVVDRLCQIDEQLMLPLLHEARV
jgi:hypothetical protein